MNVFIKWLSGLKFKYIDCYCRVKVGDCFVVIGNAGAVDIGDVIVVLSIDRRMNGKTYYNQLGSYCEAFTRKLYKKI